MIDSLGFKKPLLPPPPLGYFQTALGENSNSGENFLFFQEVNSDNILETDFPQTKKTTETSINSKSQNLQNHDEDRNEDINTSSQYINLQATIDTILSRKPLGQFSPLVKESDFPTFNLNSEIVNKIPVIQTQLENQQLYQNISPKPQSKKSSSDETPIYHTQGNVQSNLNRNSIEETSIVQTQPQNPQSDYNILPKSGLNQLSPILETSTSLIGRDTQPKLNPNIFNQTPIIQNQLNQDILPESNSQQSLPGEENLTSFPTQPQLNSINPVNDNHTPIVQNNKAFQQLPQNTLKSQTIKSLPEESQIPIAKNIPSITSQQPNFLTTDITQSQTPIQSQLEKTSQNIFHKSELPLKRKSDDFDSEFDISSQNSTKNIPSAWSNISELIKEKHQPSEAFVSKKSNTTNNNPTLNDSELSSEAKTKSLSSKGNIADEEEIEIIAKQVYILLKQRLEVNSEKIGQKSLIYTSFNPNYISSNKLNSNLDNQEDINIDLFQNKQLQELTQEVNIMIQQRLEIERERYSN